MDPGVTSECVRGCGVGGGVGGVTLVSVWTVQESFLCL